MASEHYLVISYHIMKIIIVLPSQYAHDRLTVIDTKDGKITLISARVRTKLLEDLFLVYLLGKARRCPLCYERFFYLLGQKGPYDGDKGLEP